MPIYIQQYKILTTRYQLFKIYAEKKGEGQIDVQTLRKAM